MSVFYNHVCSKLGWPVDAALLKRLEDANSKKLAAVDAEIADAKENYGDEELYDKVRGKARYFAQIGDSGRAQDAYKELGDAKISIGQKVDMAMEQALLAFLLDDSKEARKHIEKAKALNDKGGDWDRRNRLKVYEAMQFVWARKFTEAADLLLSCVSTFTCAEMMSYKDFSRYTVLLNMLHLERPKLAKKVVNSPDLLSTSSELPKEFSFVRAFYDCRYADLFRILVEMEADLASDRFLGRHVAAYVRHLRVRAYGQFLEAYKSVTLDGIASAFGVTTAFIDAELARFISSRRLHAKIDRVAAIVESTRPDTKNGKYHQVLRTGDALMAKVQRLARAVNV
jgi:26S proteasome regulatory subunit N7